MEFPGLGDHCSNKSCKQLDFLPMTCDACQMIFCKDHIVYTEHDCKESYKKDNQVPVCPLCNCPVPIKRGEQPDLKVGQHIDNDCESDPAKERRKIYTNRCNMKGCKTKELVPIRCDNCQKNFCLKHRHEQDHKCQGFLDSGRGGSRAGAAAVFRSPAAKPAHSNVPKSGARPQQTPLSTGIGRDLDRERRERQQTQAPRAAAGSTQPLQAGMSEDEAMARALAMSMQDVPPQGQPAKSNKTPAQQQQEEEDMVLARALAESEREARRPTPRPQQQQTKDKCSMS